MATKADIWRDLAEIMTLLDKLEEELDDPRIAEAKELTKKAISDLKRVPLPGPLGTF